MNNRLVERVDARASYKATLAPKQHYDHLVTTAQVSTVTHCQARVIGMMRTGLSASRRLRHLIQLSLDLAQDIADSGLRLPLLVTLMLSSSLQGCHPCSSLSTCDAHAIHKHDQARQTAQNGEERAGKHVRARAQLMRTRADTVYAELPALLASRAWQAHAPVSWRLWISGAESRHMFFNLNINKA